MDDSLVLRNSLTSLDINGYWRLYVVSGGKMTGTDYLFLYNNGSLYSAENINEPWDESSISSIDMIIHTMNMFYDGSAYLKLIKKI